MKRYSILKPIPLSFHDGREQFDAIIIPGASILEADKYTIWLVQNGIRTETNTRTVVLEDWLKDKSIIEIKKPKKV